MPWGVMGRPATQHQERDGGQGMIERNSNAEKREDEPASREQNHHVRQSVHEGEEVASHSRLHERRARLPGAQNAGLCGNDAKVEEGESGQRREHGNEPRKAFDIEGDGEHAEQQEAPQRSRISEERRSGDSPEWRAVDLR